MALAPIYFLQGVVLGARKLLVGFPHCHRWKVPKFGRVSTALRSTRRWQSFLMERNSVPEKYRNFFFWKGDSALSYQPFRLLYQHISSIQSSLRCFITPKLIVDRQRLFDRITALILAADVVKLGSTSFDMSFLESGSDKATILNLELSTRAILPR